MACKLCQIPIDDVLCNVCRCLVEEDLPTVPRVCDHCGYPVDNPADTLCRLCTALLVVIENSTWLMRSHDQWQHENLLLAKRKWELMGTGGSSLL
ncbi:MAG: hypothetical protein HYX72_01525 [Acidobacteria bacterium]|nr:hypothetical protein [Acidobacteriota bacterium]